MRLLPPMPGSAGHGFGRVALLGDAATDWGRYYDHQPVVLAGQIPVALKALSRRGALSGVAA